MTRLSAATLRGPQYEPGIVHLGLGNFHRAHQAAYTAAALAEEDGPWGIIGAANRSRTVVSAMREQDFLYSVVELSPESTGISVPGVHSEVLVAADKPETLIERIAAPSTRIVTLTITERGYTRAAAPIELIRAGLRRRADASGAPISIVSCDNLNSNGKLTRSLVCESAGDLVPWIDANVTFPSTMVDRMVPATTPEHRALAAERLGLDDRAPVPAEPFSMWVLEDAFAAGRPRWEAGGAIFTQDVAAYEVLKLRLLNGTHLLIAYLGLLSGHHTIAEAVAQPFIESAARAVITEDYLPTLTVPPEIEINAYIEQLFHRFGNSALHHRAEQVALNGTLKLRQRLVRPALEHLSAGRVPQLLALTVAAYLCCDDDPANLDPELSESTPFTQRVDELREILRRHGPEAAVQEAL